MPCRVMVCSMTLLSSVNLVVQVVSTAACGYSTHCELHRCHRAHAASRCCAERNLLSSWVIKAQKQNVPRHQVICWVRRKAGGQLTVWRQLADGTLGVSVPCIVCRNVLAAFDLRVKCMVAPGEWFRGYLTDKDAPQAKLTSAQERMMGGRK